MNNRLENLDLERKIRLLTGADLWSLHPEPRLGLHRLEMSDGPAGARRDEQSPAATLPCPTALAATWDPDRVERIGRLLAAECRRQGIDVLLAPTVNLQRSPYRARHFECLSEDPWLTAGIGAAFVRGLQSQGVAAAVKHFAVEDSSTTDVWVGERALRELYLQPFEVLVREAGVWAVLAAGHRVNGTALTESPILKQEWDFDGVTMSDRPGGRSTTAGLDLMMPGPHGPWREHLIEELRDGRITEEQIDEKVRRILRLADRVDALENSEGSKKRTPERPEPGTDVRREPANEAAVRRELRATAAAGFVLLRNAFTPPDPDNIQDHPLLPLTAGELHKIAVIGPAVDGTLGEGPVLPPHTVSPVAGLRAALPPAVRVEAVPGVRPRVQPVEPVSSHAGDDLEIQQAVNLAAAADVAVVVVGSTEDADDRRSLVLPGRQDELVRRVADANPRTVVVVTTGAPVLLPWRHLVPAVLLAWFPGGEFGNALADVLLGVVEPGGRLPTTWPQDETGLPSTTPVDGVLHYDEGLHVGYRRFLRDEREPAYWFGHGLGYSEWEFGSTVVLGAEDAAEGGAAGESGEGSEADGPEYTVRVRLRNSGPRPGRQVVQVYLARPDSAVERPRRWLAGYAGVRAEPGEKTTAVIAVPRRAFAHWDVHRHGWVVEPGEFELSVGRSVIDLIASTTVTPRPG